MVLAGTDTSSTVRDFTRRQAQKSRTSCNEATTIRSRFRSRSQWRHSGARPATRPKSLRPSIATNSASLIFSPRRSKMPASPLGYAQAEDRLEELLKNYRRASGTMAEISGPSFFQDDVTQRTMRHAEISKARYNEINPKMRAAIESYQAGIKQFMNQHPEQVPSWAQEIHPWDVVAFGRYVIWNWPMGEAAGDLGRAGIAFAPLSYRGSNEMLIAPKRTAMNAPIAVIDPHVQWYGSIRFYEVRIYTPEFNVAGVSLWECPCRAWDTAVIARSP